MKKVESVKPRLRIFASIFLLAAMNLSVLAGVGASRDVIVHVTGAAENPASSAAPRAVFEKSWIDYDVVQGSEDGMKIHLKFTVYELKNVDCAIRFRLQDDKDKWLMDKNGKFKNAAGEVAFTHDLKPGYEPAVYEDLVTFVPYSELDVADGEWNLKIDIDLVYKNGTLIQHLGWHNIKYTQSPTDTDSVSAKIEKKWIDYDITRNGRKGMLVHVKLTVNGLKGVDTRLTIRIVDSKDAYLAASSNEFTNASGELEIPFEMKPGYDPAVYDDAQIFVPYSEIVIGKGTHKLRLDFDLWYDEGELIQHLDYHDFEFIR